MFTPIGVETTVLIQNTEALKDNRFCVLPTACRNYQRPFLQIQLADRALAPTIRNMGADPPGHGKGCSREALKYCHTAIYV